MDILRLQGFLRMTLESCLKQRHPQQVLEEVVSKEVVAFRPQEHHPQKPSIQEILVIFLYTFSKNLLDLVTFFIDLVIFL